MTIDTSTINSNYPIAGQSNSTAGFRSNFAATKTLLEDLQQQITDLAPETPPTLATVATSGSYNDLLNKPSLFSGSYDDLTNKPAEPEVIYKGSSVLVSAVNTEFSVSRITTATTGTLAGPTAPQQLEGVEITLIKASADTVVTVITVEDPGWTGAGTITFTNPGETATLINVNELWYIKSINGAAIA
jgi:hypothetical protein